MDENEERLGASYCDKPSTNTLLSYGVTCLFVALGLAGVLYAIW